jgi:choloylglycine hydrolase
MNEKGLSFAGLMFTGAQYQAAVPGKFVTNADLCSWILGNFATVDEVKKAIPTVNIADMIRKEFHGSLGLHVAVHDASGKSIVIEFSGGSTRVFDNPLGVMTNKPGFEWHMNNLRNYINLDANDKKPRTINGVTIEPTGVGSGLLGLPGDWTPPSRFVKVAFCVNGAVPMKNGVETVNLAEHIMNSVDIPIGLIKEHPFPFIKIYGNAQWSVIYDLTNLVFYYRTYDSMTLRKIELKKMDFSEGAPKKSIPIKVEQYIIDMTGDVK